MADTTARIVLTAEDKTAAALASLRGGLSGVTNQANALRGVFGTLVPALTITGAAAFVKNINDGVDAMNDLKDATGASIENISALEDVAARTGTSFETVGSALIKFNQALNSAKPDSDAALALKAIGLEANALKKLDPAEALRRTAVALAGFADDGNKARLAQELFGKSLKEVAPLLKDLAEQGELVGKVTTQQAEEAEKFNNQLSALKKNATDAGRQLTAQLIPALTDVFKTFEAGVKSTNGFLDAVTTLGTINPFFTAGENIKRYRAELEELTVARDRYAKMGFSTAAYDKDIQDLQKKLTYLKEVQRIEALAGEEGNQSAAESARLRTLRAKSAINFDPEAVKKQQELTKKLNEEARKDLLKGIDDRIQDEERLDEILRKIIDERNKYEIEAREKQMQQVFEFIDQEQEDAIAAGRDIILQSEEDGKRMKEVARDLGLTFSSAFEDAVVGGKEFSDVLKGIEQDILRIILRKNVTEPLAAKVSGIDFGSLFSSFGSGGSDVPIDGYAGGGYTGSGARSGGLDGQGGFLAMLHPQESVIDHTLPRPMVQGGGAMQITYAPVIQVDSRTDRREVAELIDRSLRNNNAQLVDQLSRQGRI